MEGPDVLVAGETLIDFVPDSTGPLPSVETFSRRAGGAPANVAVMLASLGDAPLFWTRIGTEPFGEYLLSTFEDVGLPDRYIVRDSGASTGLAFLADERDGRTFTFYRDRSADTMLERGTVEDDDLAAVDWVHLGGVALSREPARSAILGLAERANELECTVSVDPSVRPSAWTNETELRTVTGWLIEEADVVFATPAELDDLGFDGDGPESLADAVTAWGPHTVVLTLGDDGALGVTTDDAPWSGTVAHEGFDVDVVDDTGAGDAFVAGAIRSLLDGKELAESLAVGNAAGALATTERGAMVTTLSWDRVNALRTD